MSDKSTQLDFLTTRRLIQIPGPNPIIKMGDKGEWDERLMEAGEIFKDYIEGQEVYYFYYHGRPFDEVKWPRTGYRVGVATATQPLGPFSKPPQNPLLDHGPEGAWDDAHVACPCIIKQGPGKYIMWYAGIGSSEEHGKWSVGVATASHPLGPWEKYEGNPIIVDCGYPGGVNIVDGKYYMHNAHPISSYAPDYSPFVVYTADDPYGPWESYEGNPILIPGDWGAWDDSGYSEGRVLYHEGFFHAVYGGGKEGLPRMRTVESIGYAVSEDGYNFVKHVDNPVAQRVRNPDVSAFAEVQCLIESPFIYIYHTHRYLSSERPDVEELGVQVLAMSSPFKLNMPVLELDELAPGATSELAACPPICLDHVSSLALTMGCAFDEGATSGVRVHLLASDDGFDYDSVDWHTFEVDVAAGQVARKSVDVSPSPRFLKVALENLDQRHSARDLAATATLGG